eukprot:TRINITY_DN2949_c1_g1_i1.p1 TRINITY_DN2949_c1_g1~~TRINITY_DN2949_c1_g1_i1.p1  ORF type:complete len:494 (+),score=147.42 TRINITY_DN2949_c1_g1_i1:41-1522(+)
MAGFLSRVKERIHDKDQYGMMRRCIVCNGLYQSDPTVYAVTQETAEWTNLKCGKCEQTVWYCENGGTSVSCWSCRYVNAIGVQPNKKGFLDNIWGGGKSRRQSSTPAPQVPEHAHTCKREGLCRVCTLHEAGLDEAGHPLNDDDAKDDKEFQFEAPPSPTSLEACNTALFNTEWSLRRITEEDETRQRLLLKEAYKGERDLDEVIPLIAEPTVPAPVESDSDSDAKDDFDEPDPPSSAMGYRAVPERLLRPNTATQINTPEQAEMSPTRQVPSVPQMLTDDDSGKEEVDEGEYEGPTGNGNHLPSEHGTNSKEVEVEVEEDEKEEEQIDTERIETPNTAIQPGTPEVCEVSPMRALPKMQELPARAVQEEHDKEDGEDKEIQDEAKETEDETAAVEAQMSPSKESSSAQEQDPRVGGQTPAKKNKKKKKRDKKDKKSKKKASEQRDREDDEKEEDEMAGRDRKDDEKEEDEMMAERDREDDEKEEDELDSLDV